MEDLDRNTAKFYDKIRPNLKQLKQSSPVDRNRTSNFVSTSSHQEESFGKVTKEEMENVLKAYETQQNDPNMSDKPVTCDENIIKGGSYAKLLYAKAGFHYIGSTDYLTKELGIEDVDRASFLGEFSRFTVSNTEDLNGIRRNYLNATIMKIIETAYYQMNTHQMDMARDSIKKALELNQRSGIAKLAKGIHHYKMRQYEEAAREFKEALSCEDVDKRQVSVHLSEALFNIGLMKYHANRWAESAMLLNEALKANPEHGGSRLHLDLCQEHMMREDRRNSYSFRPAHPGYRR